MSAGWQIRAFCFCGWSEKATFGNIWFVQTNHPVCPDCGSSANAYKGKTVSFVDGAWVEKMAPIRTKRTRSIFERVEWAIIGFLLKKGFIHRKTLKERKAGEYEEYPGDMI